jgi:hypothetical protein
MKAHYTHLYRLNEREEFEILPDCVFSQSLHILEPNYEGTLVNAIYTIAENTKSLDRFKKGT